MKLYLIFFICLLPFFMFGQTDDQNTTDLETARIKEVEELNTDEGTTFKDKVIIEGAMSFPNLKKNFPLIINDEGEIDTTVIESGDAPAMDGSRAIRRTDWSFLGGEDLGDDPYEVLENLLWPTTPPICAISGTGSTTYEYQNAANVLQVDLTYSVTRDTYTEELATATIACNASPGNFTAGSFHDGNGANDQSDSQLAVELEVNTTNTFTVAGTTTDGRSCSNVKTYNFVDKRYWFSDSDGTIADIDILLGSQDFNAGYSSGGVTYSFTSLSSDHVVIALPYNASYPSTAKIGAFIDDISNYFIEYDDGGDPNYQLTNASNADRTYKVLVSIQKYTAATLDVILYQ